MAGRVEGKVAFITGAARGQGRSHAIRLAQEGADIIAVDIPEQVGLVPYPMATAEDLAETVKQVEALDRRIIAGAVDVRDAAGLEQFVLDGVAELGRLDIVSANAGIGAPTGPAAELSAEVWQTMIDINLTGVFNTFKASIGSIRAGGRGGSLILTSSEAGIKPYANLAHYVAAKHGVVGLMKTLALELAPEYIRVNTINPTGVNTPMIHNDATYSLFMPGNPNPTGEQMGEVMVNMNAIPIPWVEPVDISNALLFLASDESRFITGITVPVDAGSLLK